jgi:hypothetical protein
MPVGNIDHDPFADCMEQRISVQMGVADCLLRLRLAPASRGSLSNTTQKPCWGKCWGIALGFKEYVNKNNSLSVASGGREKPKDNRTDLILLNFI